MTIELNKKEFKNCNYCGEEILKVAKKCKHCGEIVDEQLREIESLKKRQAQLENNKSSNNIQLNNNIVGGQYQQRVPYGHGWHFIFTIITGGFWLIPWILFYLFRNKNRYF